MAAPEKQLSVAVMISHASYLFPAGEPGRLELRRRRAWLVTLLNWATSSHVKSLEMAFVLIDERRSDVSDRITGNPYVATIEVPLPTRAGAARVRFATSPRAARMDRQRLARVGLHAGAARDAQRRHVAQRSVGARSSRRLDGRPASRLDAVPRHEEAPDRAAVSGAARVHRAEVEARHGHRARGGEAAAARRRGVARARRARLRADGLSDLRPGRHGQIVPRDVRRGRDRHPVRDAQELSLEVRRRDGRQSRARAVACCARWAR